MAQNAQQTDKKTYQRLFVPITREDLPRVADRYPFIYLERGRLEIDDSSLKWIDANGSVIRLPVATLNCLLLGPGTSITHEAIKVASQANCLVCWVGEDSMVFYAHGITPTADTRNLRRQMELAMDESLRVKVARAMYRKRFPDFPLEEKSVSELMGMEGIRVREIYEQKAQEYGVGWKGRKYVPGKFEISDMTNKLLSSMNHALYSIITSCIYAMGYTPRIGFIHSGSPLPLTYDFADLYKAELSIDLAFALTLSLGGEYNRHTVAEAFRKRVIEMDLVKNIASDLDEYLGEKNAGRYRK